MHYANAEKSDRLLRCLRVLRLNKSHGVTTLTLQLCTGSMAPSTDISELRAQGYDIRRVYEGLTLSGRKINRYYYKGKKNA